MRIDGLKRLGLAGLAFWPVGAGPAVAQVGAPARPDEIERLMSR